MGRGGKSLGTDPAREFPRRPAGRGAAAASLEAARCGVSLILVVRDGGEERSGPRCPLAPAAL